MFVTKHFLYKVVEEQDKHPGSIDSDTWYQQAYIFETRTSYPFSFGEESYRKNNIIHQGQDQGIWLLLFLQEEKL